MKRFLFFIILFSCSLFAHRVNVFAYKEGNKIYTESYFSDGTPARNGKIDIYDENGKKILEGQTDKKGNFSFNAPESQGTYKVVLTASMGHRAETSIIIGEAPPQKQINETVTKKEMNNIKAMIEESVEKSIYPLMKSIEQEKRRIRITDILGGIGYIFGIFGIVLFFIRKKK